MASIDILMPDDGGNALVTHASRGLASAADRLSRTAQAAMVRPRRLDLATGRLVGLLRSLKTDAVSVRLAFTESENGGIRDDRLAALALQLERYLDALIAESEQVDQAAQQPGGDESAKTAVRELAEQILTLKLWLGCPMA